MVMAEMTCPTPEARITPGCPGLWTDEQEEAWRRIVEWVHRDSPARIALQLGHSGAKGSTRRAWDGIDLPLPAEGPEANWDLVSASPQQYLPGVSAWAREITRAEMTRVREAFVMATVRAARRVRLARAALRTRVPLVELHLTAHQSPHRCVWWGAAAAHALSP